MIALEEIDDPDLLRKHAQVFQGHNEYLQKRIKALTEELAGLKGLGQLELEVVRQHEQLAKLRHKVFGESSERRPSPHPPGDEPAKKKTGHGPTPQLKLPTREEHHRLPDDARTCPACDGTLEEMGEVTEDAEEITVERRRYVVVKHKRHKYRCRCNGAVKTAPAPLRLIPGGRYSIDFAIALGIDKRLNHRIAVGTALRPSARAAPRTAPSERNYRNRLLPRVRSSKRSQGYG